MTGDSVHSLRLEAVTVSVNYTDYLRCILDNRRQFDRWLILTHATDLETIALCEAEGLEYFCSQRLYEGGATFHKAAALNEGLALLSSDAWRAVVDSDILLPADFRQRLERLTLRREFLYGLSGRIVCEHATKFARLKPMQPWQGNAERAHFVIGYFQMFHSSQSNQTFPEHTGDASTYDVLFSRMFPSSRHGLLPFLALHAGPICENWQGRSSVPFFGESGDWPARVVCDVAQEFKTLGLPLPRLAVVGYASPLLLRELATTCAEVHYFDHSGILNEHPDPLWNESREWYRTEFAPGNLPGSVRLERIHEAGVGRPEYDAVLFLNEVEYDFLLKTLPAWLPVLRAGGVLCGVGYLPGPAPDTVIALDMLLGSVRASSTGSGFWSRTVAQPGVFLLDRMPQPIRGDQGLVYVCRDEADVEAITVSLWSLSRHWKGPVAVLQCPPESASLRLVCARLGVLYLPVPEPPAGCTAERQILAALAWTPWPDTLYMEAETLVQGSVGPLLKACAESPTDTVVFGVCGPEAGPSDVCFAASRDYLQEMPDTGNPSVASQSAGAEILDRAGFGRAAAAVVLVEAAGIVVDLRILDEPPDAWFAAAAEVVAWLKRPEFIPGKEGAK